MAHENPTAHTTAPGSPEREGGAVMILHSW
jgi:hypothetical protein